MLYLAYGSNLHPTRTGERVPSATLLGTTVVINRVLQFHKRSVDGSAKCNMTRGDGAVHAAVYDIPADEKPYLDQAEGLGLGYRTETLEVPGHGECYTYIAIGTQIDESLKPYSWYKQLVIVGCQALQFPQRYIDSVAAVDCIADPDNERHARNMQIVRRARTARIGNSE